MSDHLELDRVKAPAKEPAKAWRNKWRFMRAPKPGEFCHICGKSSLDHLADPLHDPRVYWSCWVWPSKDTAETYAARHLGRGQDYLGAFPVDAA